ERAVIGRAQHHQSTASTLRLPTLPILVDEGTGNQPATAVGDEMDRLLLRKPAVDLGMKLGSRDLEVLAPVVPEGVYVPAFSQGQQEFTIVPFHDPGGLDGEPRIIFGQPISVE